MVKQLKYEVEDPADSKTPLHDYSKVKRNNQGAALSFQTPLQQEVTQDNLIDELHRIQTLLSSVIRKKATTPKSFSRVSPDPLEWNMCGRRRTQFDQVQK